MNRSRALVGLAFGLACAFVVVTSSAQKKKPPPKGTQAAAPAAAPVAKPAPRGRGTTTAGKKPEDAKPPDTEAKAPAATGHQVVERESHIEFDERMVRGQSAAGAIYLFNRQPSEFKSIVKVPESFRDRTTVLVKPRGETP
jgi:hypothetical protein